MNSIIADMNYTKTESEQSEWQAKIYHKVATLSLEECAAICRISYISSRECDVFSWDGSDCYIGEDALNSHTITVPSGLSDVYMDQGMCGKNNCFVTGIDEPVYSQLSLHQKLPPTRQLKM